MPLTIYPTKYFYPRTWHGIQDVDYHNKHKLPEESYMFQYGITTNSLFNKYGGLSIPDYYTPPDVKKDLIDCLEKVIILFDEFDIKYSIAYGTLLGAVRHKDMIPWDDDIDLDVPDDYISKLLSPEFSKKLNDINLDIFVNRYNGLPDKKPLVIKIFDKLGSKTGYKWKFPFIDLFITTLENDKYIKKRNKNYGDFANGYYKKENFDKIKDYEFNRLIVKGISNPEDFLINKYGSNWQTQAYVECWDHKRERPRPKNKCGQRFKINYTLNNKK